MKTMEIKKLIAGVEEMERMPIGHTFTIIKSRKKDGTEKCTEYKKVSDTHVEIVRNYECS